MTILGAVLAGGRSLRFGSDKAVATIGGATLLSLAISAASQLCPMCIVIGRRSDLAPSAPDWPRPGMGPLGGLAGALAFAADHGFAAVFSLPVDCVALPSGLLDRLSSAPAFVRDQPVVGLWPTSALPGLRQMLTSDGPHSMRAFAESIGACAIDAVMPNVNRPEDLAALIHER